MRGCLTGPLRLLGCLGVILLLVAGYLYRDRIILWVHDFTGRRPAGSEIVGRPTEGGAQRALDKIDSLNAWRADSVVLTAAEMASLIGAGLDPAFRGQVDSLAVSLGEDRIGIEASLLTDQIPRSALGPLGTMVDKREHLSASGTVELVEPGRAVWIVDRLSLGSFPFPRDVIPRLLEKAMGSHSSEVPFTVPHGLRAVKVRPTGVSLFGSTAEP
jgi:hypothetical protein